MKPIITHTRKITFEVYDEHPVIGQYCVFANESVDKTNTDNIDFIYVSELREINGDVFVISPDLYNAVKLKFCWRIEMTVHD